MRPLFVEKNFLLKTRYDSKMWNNSKVNDEEVISVLTWCQRCLLFKCLACFAYRHFYWQSMPIQTAHTLPPMTACIVQYHNSGLSEQSAPTLQEIMNDRIHIKMLILKNLHRSSQTSESNLCTGVWSQCLPLFACSNKSPDGRSPNFVMAGLE